MTNRHTEGDDSAEGLAQEDRFLDLQHLAELGNIRDPGVEVPVVG
jgi:hypothetical protein